MNPRHIKVGDFFIKYFFLNKENNRDDTFQDGDESVRNRRPILTSILTSVLTFAVLTILAVGYIGTRIGESPVPRGEATQPPAQEAPPPQQIAAEGGEPVKTQVTDVVGRAVQSVVGISVLRPDGNSIFQSAADENWGVGSGIIVDPNGYILTNHHVAGGKNKRIVVTLSGGENLDGTTLWSDPVIDLAVVKVESTGLPAAKLGDSNNLKVGEPAIAIGNPLGLQFQRTVTSGIVSALNRTIQIPTDQGSNFMEDLIQTDASINPGNSGGPLMNARGEVIGINTIKVASAEAIGFAIPINIAKPVVDSFRTRGSFEEPYLGLFAYDGEVMPYVDPNLEVENGVYVARLDTGGPACAGGIGMGDVIKKVDGTNVETMADLRTLIYGKKPNDRVTLYVESNGAEKSVTVVLGRKTRDGLVTR